MSAIAKSLLSGSTNGRNVKITQTSSSGDTVHTAPAGTATLDEVWLFATNTHIADVNLTIQFGGTSNPDDNMNFTLKAYQGLTLLIPGLLLNNSLVVKAFASVTNVIIINGYVNRITP
jgi:hypothetical protein